MQWYLWDFRNFLFEIISWYKLHEKYCSVSQPSSLVSFDVGNIIIEILTHDFDSFFDYSSNQSMLFF